MIEALAGRFERRVTVVQGGAGFGKSTLLAQAIEQNRLAPRGVDVWLGCVPADESADHLAGGLWAALALLGEGAGGGEPASVATAVWALAPTDVALILDDAHLVPDGSSGADYLADLVESLPTNGHVVLSSRHPVPLPLAKRRAAGTAVVLDEADLAFDADELDQFVAARGLDPSVVEAAAGWPAMVELRAGAGAAVADDFLWEEVLSQIEPERRAAFERIARFSVVDDELARAVTGEDASAQDLIRGIPLTTIDGGSVRVHDLWRQSLGPSPSPDPGVRAGAVLLQHRGQFREAFDILDQMHDRKGVADLVDRLAATGLPELHTDDFGYVLGRLPPALLATAQGATIRGYMCLGADGEAAANAFELAAERFREAGDGHGEASVLSQMLFVRSWNSDRDGMMAVLSRLVELAGAGVAAARTGVAL
ncbi:MAG TPA: hypothetical protein VID94_05690, partial [Acidimicrobiales bacterium]